MEYIQKIPLLYLVHTVGVGIYYYCMCLWIKSIFSQKGLLLLSFNFFKLMKILLMVILFGIKYDWLYGIAISVVGILKCACGLKKNPSQYLMRWFITSSNSLHLWKMLKMIINFLGKQDIMWKNAKYGTSLFKKYKLRIFFLKINWKRNIINHFKVVKELI